MINVFPRTILRAHTHEDMLCALRTKATRTVTDMDTDADTSRDTSGAMAGTPAGTPLWGPHRHKPGHQRGRSRDNSRDTAGTWAGKLHTDRDRPPVGARLGHEPGLQRGQAGGRRSCRTWVRRKPLRG